MLTLTLALGSLGFVSCLGRGCLIGIDQHDKSAFGQVARQAQPAQDLSDFQEKGWFGHPKGLSFIFLTEMWERFSYYGMRALLVLYMVKHLLQPAYAGQVIGYAQLKAAISAVFGPLGIQPMASQIYGIYTALVYLTPILGGLLADRFLGQKRTVIIGAVLMGIGHFMMAFEPLFLMALLVIIIGNGAFKPNTTSQVGGLYALGDPRRDRAYSIFYMGINLGAFLAPFVCGTLGENIGWHYGFAAAGVGMVLATCIYAYGLRYLPPDAHARSVRQHRVSQPLERNEWQAIGAIMLLCLFNVFFWAVFEQEGNTIALWADKDVDRHIGVLSWDFPTSWVQAIDPFFIFTLTPVLTAYWAWQARRRREPGSVAKMAIGLALAAISYLILFAAAEVAGPDGKSSTSWLLLFFFVLTTGELYLSPVGLSLVSKAAPVRVVSMMMGFWFLANFAGNYMCGWLGGFWESISHARFFMLMSLIAGLSGLAIWLLNKPLRPFLGERLSDQNLREIG